MSFGLIREGHAWAISGQEGSQGKGKQSWLCLFLAPDPLLRGCCPGNQRRAEAQRHWPKSVASLVATLRDTEWTFLPKCCLQGKQWHTPPASSRWCAVPGSSIHLPSPVCNLSSQRHELRCFYFFVHGEKKPLWPLSVLSWKPGKRPSMKASYDYRCHDNEKPYSNHKELGAKGKALGSRGDCLSQGLDRGSYQELAFASAGCGRGMSLHERLVAVSASLQASRPNKRHTEAAVPWSSFWQYFIVKLEGKARG